MKKLFLMFIASFAMTVVVSAQVVEEHISLADALKKAKEEKKIVLVMVSTTWCGPCKAIKEQVFPIKEVGDYFNSRFVFLHYDVDVEDPEKIVKTYGVESYPTFLVLGEDGKEENRMVGAGRSLPEFMAMIDHYTNPDNFPSARTNYLEQLHQDNFNEVLAMHQAGQHDQARGYFMQLFPTRDIKMNFSPYYVEYYKTYFPGLGNPIAQYVMQHSAEVEEVMGKEAFDSFCSNMVTAYLLSGAVPYDNKKALLKAIKPIKSYRFLCTPSFKFVSKYAEEIANRDTDTLIEPSYQAYMESDADGKSVVVGVFMVTATKGNGIETSKVGSVVKLLDKCIAGEENAELAEGLKNIRSVLVK